jgi:hypothetical protein
MHFDWRYRALSFALYIYQTSRHHGGRSAIYLHDGGWVYFQHYAVF